MNRAIDRVGRPRYDVSTLEQRCLDALDVNGIVATAADLIAVPSDGGGETPVQEHMIGLMRGAGLAVDAWEIDPAAYADHPVMRTEIGRDSALGVVGALGEGDPHDADLVLNGHVDVEPAGDLMRWTRPPFEGTVKGGRLYGRGSCDMKGAMAAAVLAVRAIRDAGVMLEGAVTIQSVIGEEDGGLGTVATLDRGYRGKSAIVMEPTAGAVAPAVAGAVGFEVTVPGLAAHGAERERGENPMQGFVCIHEALLELERQRNAPPRHPMFDGSMLPWPLSIGVLRSGTRPSSVPEWLVFEGRLGVRVGETIEQARDDFEAAVRAAIAHDDWLRMNPPRVAWTGGVFRSAETDAGHPIVVTTRDAAGVIRGARPRLEGMRYGADMHWLVHDGGIPTVLHGPGDIRQAHSPDEFVMVEDLVDFARTLVLVVLRTCRPR